jgi:hypothetical protein
MQKRNRTGLQTRKGRGKRCGDVGDPTNFGKAGEDMRDGDGISETHRNVCGGEEMYLFHVAV